MVKIGILGLGNIGQQHLRSLHSGEIENASITAICSRHPPKNIEEIPWFADYRELIDAGLCDAVIIASPSYMHLEMGLYALQAGLHTLIEKPIALSTGDGEKLIAEQKLQAKRRPDCAPQLAVMLNQRCSPVYQRMKQIIDAGTIGEISRTQWTMTNWFRPEIYFKASDWRATWKGEGGGLLLNQCIHNLDIYQWLCGMPATIKAHCHFGKYHDIEVEDEVSAYFEYSNGATGLFVGSTGEAPGKNCFDIVGDLGCLNYDGERLLLTKNAQSSRKYSNTTKEMFGTPENTVEQVSYEKRAKQHSIMLNNFVAAVTDNAVLVADGEAGLAGLAFANAMLLSSWTDQTVALPFDTKVYQQQLDKKIKGSSLRQASTADVHIDMDKSFR